MLGTLTLPSQSSLLPRRRFTCAAVSEAAPPAADNRSLYEVLRVKRDASPTEIKTAYRTLAKLHHPDARSRFMESSSIASSATDGRDFIEIRDAYATLSDPDARSVYDSDLKRRWNGAGLRSPGRGGFCPTRKWETDQCW